jgi:hypothetical protein
MLTVIVPLLAKVTARGACSRSGDKEHVVLFQAPGPMSTRTYGLESS